MRKFVEILLFLLMLAPMRLWAVGWTPTDGGLVVDLEQGDRFLLSVVVNGKEYFVANYNRYTGGDFNYTAGSYLKLIPQAAGATVPSDMTIWSAGAPLARESGNTKLLPLGGIVYTIWNDGKTLRTNNTNYQFMGDLTDDYNYKDACDVVFVVPTNHTGITSFDPNRTLTNDRGYEDQAADGKINGRMGKGFLGMTYREVYMLDIPRLNPPMAYTNASLVTFNTTNKQKSWSNGQIKCDPGHAAYAFADPKHQPTTRTLFRLYMLDKPISYCSSYFFATDEQDVKSYRNAEKPKNAADSTAPKKIYTWDHMTPMKPVNVETSPLYKTDFMHVPAYDSTYYYVGYNNDYRIGGETMGSGDPGAHSQFEKIRTLPIKDLSGFTVPAGAYGRMVVDTTSSNDNLGVAFEPVGYMLKVSTGTNVQMKESNTRPGEWTTEQMWKIDSAFYKLSLKATLLTGPEFTASDPGVDIDGWSEMMSGAQIKEQCGVDFVGKAGWAIIDTKDTKKNGNIKFILADPTLCIHYDNNGFLGTQIPDQYPMELTPEDPEKGTVRIEGSRLKPDYTFLGWSTSPSGAADPAYAPGTQIDLDDVLADAPVVDGKKTLTLYAHATYNGTYNVAVSFMHGGKRYFLTHPGSAAPRYSRARAYDDWANVWQGMANAENVDPLYLNTFELRHPANEIKANHDPEETPLQDNEMVFDPRRYVLKGYEDSLLLYENFAPAKDEYIGLYYQAPNSILANNTWAGLFVADKWPDFREPSVKNVKLRSTRYVEEEDPVGHPDSLTIKVRSNNESGTYVKYIPATNQFDGCVSPDAATEFQISAIVVADAHYIVLPDTTKEWRDEITFAYHENEPIIEPVWSSLIGKQLMACMMVGDDTTYFHPNPKKIIDDPNNLYLSADFRVSQYFSLIRDTRVATTISAGDSAKAETTDHYWLNNIVSGNSSPIDVKDAGGNYIDIVDTFRINLSHGGISKIKEYRGRWHKDAPGLHMNADGSRYRDVIVTTKTYHYGDTTFNLVLQPEYETYMFSPLAGTEEQINFTLIKETSCSLLDIVGNPVSTAVIARDTVKTPALTLGPGSCSLQGSTFDIVSAETSGDHVTLSTHAENTSVVNYDTLTVTISSITVEGKTYTDVQARVPLMQAALTSNELLWSVVDNGKRYFILAKEDGLIFRQYRVNNSIMYKENSSIHLVKGTANDANNDAKYITPWVYTYTGTPNQLTLQAHLTTKNPYFKVTGSTPGVDPSAASALTYEFLRTYTNENANYEEQVLLNFGGTDDGWLKFSNGALTLTTKDKASTFSWSYLVQEYSLLNNGTYPSREYVDFGYNDRTSVNVQTLYKAYKEYSTLLNNTVTYLCREEETNVANLRDAGKEWKTDMSFTLIRDSRFGAEKDSSKLAITPDYSTLTTTVSTAKFSPIGTQYGGEYVNIVDTLDVRLTLLSKAPAYRFKGDWSAFKSVNDARLKIPLIRRTYHLASYDSLSVEVEGDHYNHSFPATITTGVNDEYEFVINTYNKKGSHMLNVYGEPVMASGTATKITDKMDFTDKTQAEIRLVDEYGNTPDWCRIESKTKNTVTVKCTKNGIRSPRMAYLYFAYIVTVDDDGDDETPEVMRFVNYRLTVSQLSSFTYTNNQRLVHSNGASGDEKMANGMQQVHTNKRILYYYPEQDVELPVRERAFYGWWRWYREGNDVNGKDVSDTDVPDSLWRIPPTNTGKYKFPFRTIGDSVMLKKKDGTDSVKVLVTMGRYTVFHYKSKDYNNKADPPSKNPRIAPPITTYGNAEKPTLTYSVDISNYYDNLPMSVSDKNQVDVALLDTALEIHEPTLSLREVFELHPWTEMAEKLEDYKDPIASPCTNLNYMEDHVVMAPIGNRLLLQTEQRYRYDHLANNGHSESLLGYYMRDDNWNSTTGGWTFAGETDEERAANRRVCQDTMIWCGGWDTDCEWYTYNPHAPSAEDRYQPCTHSITEEDDFLQVPAKTSISTGNEFDTVYYCLRARSMKTENPALDDGEPGDFMFNICRYMIIYHNPNQYGPLKETTNKGVTKALISKDEIEQRYDVLERLDFDYVQPGSAYHVYPHPLPWSDASYGYTYPETSDLPHNRYHNESDFPNHGEYGLINRIPYSSYWHKMEQHGGAENGYMIYCDGMASAGQVAALTLNTNLCAGQKMFFSAYVGNPSSQTGKSDPNFIFSVQGMTDEEDAEWEDITSYMTGDIKPSNQWYQIFFPIRHIKEGETEYTHFRVRIYNVAANFDGNDFIIDDMCIFATKPPLIAYQAQTTCSDYGDSETDTHVLLRIDYQGITGEGYNNANVFYTVRQKTRAGVYSFVNMTDGYLREEKHEEEGAKVSVCGRIYIPAKNYEPQDKDSIYQNMNDLIDRFDATREAGETIVREGYIYEILEGEVRPVKYIVHNANMLAQNDYTVHISGTYAELLNSICGMTSHLKISNRMVLELNGEEQPEMEQLGLCANATYDISLRVKGALYQDSVAPIDVEGSCVNDWLLYGDTAEVSSLKRYGYKYSDIVKVVSDILRYAPNEYESNANQFAPNLAAIDRTELNRVQTEHSKQTLTPGVDPYALIDSLVTKGFLTLYKPKMTASVMTGDSLQFVILPIVGTGSQEVTDARVEVCPNPILIKLKPKGGEGVPLMVGGLNRDSTEEALPVDVLVSEMDANKQFKLRVDSIMERVGIYSIDLRSTDDPDFREGVHTIRLIPDKNYPSGTYYVKGDSIILRPSKGNNYKMKAGYNYTFNIVMQTWSGSLRVDPENPNSCEVGTVPFILSIVPDYLKWDPKSEEDNRWNNPDNWIGIDEHGNILHTDAHFVPMEHSFVLIPQMEDGLPYPVLPSLPLPYKDSVQKVNYRYNTCNAVRFLPGAAMGQQQRMEYTDAVIDMPMPQQKWALRGAPVKGMISGDLFMADADIANETPLWEVGEFDASGRSYKTGNASFWLSLYSQATIHKVNEGEDEERVAEAEWSKVTNGMTLPLSPAQGFAVYARTASNADAAVRLPKEDDRYYYYGTYGEKLYDHYEQNLRATRTTLAGEGEAGKLAFHPDGASQGYTLTNGVAGTSFVFANPSMGYIDIWGFIEDNSLKEEIDYIDAGGIHRTIDIEAALLTSDVITIQERYLPPMHAMVVKLPGVDPVPVNTKLFTLYADRIVTDPSQKSSMVRGLAPRRSAITDNQSPITKGIMTVTAINPVSPRCNSRLLLGQGFHEAILEGEDAVLTTVNIDNFHMTNTPTTPFNIYAMQDSCGLSIDLLDSIINVPISFYMSDLPYEPVTYLWFTGVNSIDGELVLYDALTDTERAIIDGICLDIETPVVNHERRYYIRRPGFTPQTDDGSATGVELLDMGSETVKFIRNGQVYIWHNGHVYTIFGQRVR